MIKSVSAGGAAICSKTGLPSFELQVEAENKSATAFALGRML